MAEGRRAGSVLRGAAVALVSLLSPTLARADAIPPPRPIHCAPGSHVTHGHGGTRCELDAPKNCPAGWIGREGGHCVLDLCGADTDCAKGTQCREAELCARH